MLNQEQQILGMVQKAKNILLATKKNYDGDSLGSAIGFALFLEKMGKPVTIAIEDYAQEKTYRFLPTIHERIKPTLEHLRKFTITLDVAKAPLGELSYTVENQKLNIYVIPKHGTYTKEQLTTNTTPFPFDLIITLDTEDMPSLGNVWERQRDFFYSTPIINIDHHAGNEQYGQVNAVDPTMSSTAEMLFHLKNAMGKHLLDADIATALLTGVIAKTKSFLQPHITPRTLHAVSELIGLGARREEIIQHLYRTRSLPTLKLWGRVLARLQHDPTVKLAWSVLLPDDFLKTQATPDELPQVLEELLGTAPDAETTVLLYMLPHGGRGAQETIDRELKAPQLHGMIRTEKGRDARFLGKAFEANGSKDFATFTIDGISIDDGEQRVIEAVREKLKG